MQAESPSKRVFIFLILDASGMVKFWHYSSGKALSTIVEEGPGIVRQSLCSGFSCTGERFAVGGADPAIHCYDAQTKQKIISLEPR